MNHTFYELYELDMKLFKFYRSKGNSFFIVGELGAGKSTFVNYMLSMMEERLSYRYHGLMLADEGFDPSGAFPQIPVLMTWHIEDLTNEVLHNIFSRVRKNTIECHKMAREKLVPYGCRIAIVIDDATGHKDILRSNGMMSLLKQIRQLELDIFIVGHDWEGMLNDTQRSMISHFVLMKQTKARNVLAFRDDFKLEMKPKLFRDIHAFATMKQGALVLSRHAAGGTDQLFWTRARPDKQRVRVCDPNFYAFADFWLDPDRAPEKGIPLQKQTNQQRIQHFTPVRRRCPHVKLIFKSLPPGEHSSHMPHEVVRILNSNDHNCVIGGTG